MRVCFHGTADELDLVAGRSLMVLLTARDLPRMRVFELHHARVVTNPYEGLHRLCADLTETEVNSDA
ncbi:hypothetical protein ACQEUU_05825 [Nonomuraea sp. CA-218870]|uniref:hypothetical protein n=1 Tax=Nonomuraea sp. CA-218870 TaxID=3239998 RepID=UPI003D8B9C3C